MNRMVTKTKLIYKATRDGDSIEKDFYKKFDYPVDFVGHPLLDAVAGYEAQAKDTIVSSGKPIIALLPGSRKQEIDTMLPLMLTMQKYYTGYQFVIAGAPSQSEKLYRLHIDEFQKQYPDIAPIQIVFNQTYQLLKQATAALVTSGTATLETALFGVPEVVCYKGGAISFAIAKKLVKVEYISLVNLIMEKEIVNELIQNDLNEVNLKPELDKLLSGNSRKGMMSDFEDW